MGQSDLLLFCLNTSNMCYPYEGFALERAASCMGSGIQNKKSKGERFHEDAHKYRERIPRSHEQQARRLRSCGIGGRGVSDADGPPLTGYSVVKADSLDAALKMAKACPHLDIGGSIVVAEVMEMKGM